MANGSYKVLIIIHDLPCERSTLLKAYKIVRSCPIQHPIKSVLGKRLVKGLQQAVKTTLLRNLTDSPNKMSQQ